MKKWILLGVFVVLVPGALVAGDVAATRADRRLNKVSRTTPYKATKQGAAHVGDLIAFPALGWTIDVARVDARPLPTDGTASEVQRSPRSPAAVDGDSGSDTRGSSTATAA